MDEYVNCRKNHLRSLTGPLRRGKVVDWRSKTVRHGAILCNGPALQLCTQPLRVARDRSLLFGSIALRKPLRQRGRGGSGAAATDPGAQRLCG
eukprot:s1831_g3.t1